MRALVAALLVAGCVLVAPAAAGATVFNVSNTNDVAAANPGTGCATPNAPPTNGACTLRSAVQAANQDNSDSTINLAAGTYKLTIAPTGSDTDSTGDLNVANDTHTLTIQGAGSGTNGSVIDANFIDRAFHVESNSPGATINGVRIVNGRTDGLTNSTTCPSNPSPSDTGGGAIRSEKSLTLNNDVITGNMTIGEGGGVFVQQSGSLSMTNTVVSNNVACPGQFIFNAGGGVATDIFFTSTVTIDHSTFSNNSAPGNSSAGGGLAALQCFDLTVTASTFSHNSSDNGGGIDTEWGGECNRPTAHIVASTINGNTATGGHGAGMNNTGPTDTIVNSTLTNNTGSGISSGSGSTAISYSTLADNNGNLDNRDSGAFTIDDTILAAAGAAGNCPGGAVTSNGHNLFDNNGDICSPSGTDLKNKDPKLGPLADNGGPTQTRALLTGSPAIDAADDGLCSSSAKHFDQRGVTRPQNAHCDIGAYEYQSDDLALKASAAKGTIKVGQKDTVTDTITNNGPATATNVVFTDPAKAGYRINSAKPAQGSCMHTTKHVTCHLGTLGSGKSTTVVIMLTGTSRGVITLNSSVHGDQTDRDPSNNNATVRINVFKPALKVCRPSTWRFVHDTIDPVQDDRITKVRAYIDGNWFQTIRGHNIHTVTINPVPPTGRHVVRLIAYLTNGQQIILWRVYHGCSHGRTHKHVEERNDTGGGLHQRIRL